MFERRYSRPDPVEEDVVAISSEPHVEDLGALETLVPVDGTKYSKAQNVRLPKAFIIVFSNGEVREKNYFSWMMHCCDQLKLEFISYPFSPDDMLMNVKEKKAEYVMTAGEDVPDAYYLVTDVDHFYSVILRSKRDYEHEDIKMIVSNPCFEVWLYYSKRSDKFDGFVIPKDRLKISQEVKRFLNVQIPGGCNPKKAVFDIKDNIVNARKNYGEDGNGIPVLFATNMFVLAEDLLPYIEVELENMIDKRCKENQDIDSTQIII